MEPRQRLDQYQRRVMTPGGYGTNITTTKQPDNTGLAIGMGILGAGATLGGAYMMGPMAAAAGGGIGGYGQNFMGPIPPGFTR